MKQRSRKPRRIISPLMLIAGMQKLHQRDAMAFVSTFDTFLYQIERGTADGTAIRGMTLFLAALYDASVHYQARNVQALIDATGDLWVRAAERCDGRGMTDRIVVNAEELAALRRLKEAMAVFLPEVQVGPWKSFMENAQRRWDKHAATSSFRHALSETS